MLQAEVSKFLSIQLLVDEGEMQALMDALPEFHIVCCSSVCDVGQAVQKKELWLENYALYIRAIKSGGDYKPYTQKRFSDIWTSDLKAVSSMEVAEGKQLWRIQKPVLQLQHHQMVPSGDDGRLKSMIRTQEGVSWGLQISYPQIFQDPSTKEIQKVDANFPNTELFKGVQRWVRQNTLPATFNLRGQRQRLPVRIGKACLDWIGCHPDFKKWDMTYGDS